MIVKAVKTPCVGICSTGIGDSVCRGCKRFAHEVIDWNAYNHDQRSAIARRLADFLAQVVRNKLDVVDASLLRSQVQHQQINCDLEGSPYCWVYELLRAGASQITDLAPYGLRLLPQWRGKSLLQLRDAIEHDYYSLSCAHYERYIAPGLQAQN